MKVKADEEEIFELKDWQKKVIQNDIPKEIFDKDMKRRLKWILEHKFERCYKRLQDEWIPKLQADKSVTSIPATQEEFVNFVTNRSDYKDRSKRDKEAKAIEDAKIKAATGI